MKALSSGSASSLNDLLLVLETASLKDALDDIIGVVVLFKGCQELWHRGTAPKKSAQFLAL